MAATGNHRFKIRFMKSDENDQVAALVADLQAYQHIKHCPRLPTGQDLEQELTHTKDSGSFMPNNLNVFIVVAIDLAKAETDNSLVGYMMYSQSFSIFTGRRLYINSFFISESYRRHGLGKKFIKFLRTHAQLTGNDSFDVPFMNNNHIGQKFYKSFGAYLVNEEYYLAALDPMP